MKINKELGAIFQAVGVVKVGYDDDERQLATLHVYLW